MLSTVVVHKEDRNITVEEMNIDMDIIGNFYEICFKCTSFMQCRYCTLNSVASSVEFDWSSFPIRRKVSNWCGIICSEGTFPG